MAEDLKSLVDERTIAASLRVSLWTLRLWRRQRSGPPHFRLGRVVRYDPDSVKAWLQAHVGDRPAAVP